MQAKDLLIVAGAAQVNLDSVYWTDYETWVDENKETLLSLIYEEIEEMDGNDFSNPKDCFERWLVRKIVEYYRGHGRSSSHIGLYISEFCRAIANYAKFDRVSLIYVTMPKVV